MAIARKVLILCCASVSLSLQAMINYYHLTSSEDNGVLIIGEKHDFDNSDCIVHFKECMGYMERFQKEKAQTLPVIVEYEKVTGTDTTDVSPFVSQMLAMEEAQQDLDTPPYSFDFYDPRTNESASLWGIMSAITQIFTTVLPPGIIEAHYKPCLLEESPDLEKSEAVWKKYIELVKRNSLKDPRTVRVFKKYLKTNFAKMKEIYEKYQTNKELAALLIDILDRYTRAHNTCLSFLAKYEDDTASFPYVFCCLIDKCETFEERMKLYDYLYIAFAQETDLLFADVLFLDKILTKLTTEKSLCVFVGYDHATNLSELLKSLKYKELHTDSALVFQLPLITALNAKKLKNLIAFSVLDEFLGNSEKE